MKIYFMLGSKRQHKKQRQHMVCFQLYSVGEDRSVATVKSSVAAKYWRGEEEE